MNRYYFYNLKAQHLPTTSSHLKTETDKHLHGISPKAIRGKPGQAAVRAGKLRGQGWLEREDMGVQFSSEAPSFKGCGHWDPAGLSLCLAPRYLRGLQQILQVPWDRWED